ncbi:MAG TPA: hypothetical protein VFC07_03605 [Verrucomicrobiae bacterium]|nr:hypothetical protein [Verrucomicrobiae bacterium]
MTTLQTRVSLALGVTSALIANTLSATSNSATISVPQDFVSSAHTQFQTTRPVATSSTTLSIRMRRRWGAAENIRFKELAHKDAIGPLTATEWAELNALMALRRETKFPLSADQILWQRKQKYLTDNLINALKKYVEFHELPSQEEPPSTSIHEE